MKEKFWDCWFWVIILILGTACLCWILSGCDNWMMPGGWAGQEKAWRDCKKAGADCPEGYNIAFSPSD